MIVADVIAKELKKEGISDIFMLTGYGAMYLNDAIEKNKIKYFAARNEAAAPMMAEAYAKAKGGIGAVCVTAGPGATNAIPGLAEAYVDSAPIVIISGTVEKKFTADDYKNLNIRTLGTAEFSVTRILKGITKYSVSLKNPKNCLYEMQKAIHIAKTGRPGPVWVEVPLDVQSMKILDVKKLKKFIIKKKGYKKNISKIKSIVNQINHSKKPVFIIGNGLKQSNQLQNFLKILKKTKIPFVSSRFANDLITHDNKLNMGLLGIKGSLHTKELMDKCDLIISLGCRLAPTLCMGNPETFAKKAKIISINNDSEELKLQLRKIDIKIKSDLQNILPDLEKYIKNKPIKSFAQWVEECSNLKKKGEINNIFSKKNPIDLYRFMYLLDANAPKKSVMVTDAGSNYYIGGQAWFFKNQQTEISSTTNAAMGLSIPLSVGAAIAKKNSYILSVTGDGSLELNVQELKTISHYKLNIKTFVINNGGYVSMKKWQGNFFKGNLLDTEELTGAGTLAFKDIAKAFGLNYLLIKSEKDIIKKLKLCFKNKLPYLVEVITDPYQKIYGKEF